jgi:ABC-type Na+ efflux pump permease subunit
VADESGLAETPFQQMLPMIAGEKYSTIEFEAVATEKKLQDATAKATSYSNKAVVLHITKEKSKYAMEIAIPNQSEVKKEEAKSLLNKLVLCFENSKLMQVGLNQEQLKVVAKPINSTISDAGEPDKSIGEYIVELIAPMLLSFILYFMIYLYGGKTCSAIVTEKTSKLIEQLLTSVHPASLIMGKVLATTCVALFQFFIWIVSGVLGYVIGDKIALSMYPGYENPLFQIFNLIKENTTQGVFTIQAIILAAIVLCIGFFFYSVLAGIVGSVLGKPEQVAVGIQIFALLVMIGWLPAYIAPITENPVLINIVRLLPFTSPFTVPADLIIGSMSIAMGCVTLLLQIITSIICVIVAGRLYIGLLLYNGSKLTLTKIWTILTARKSTVY